MQRFGLGSFRKRIMFRLVITYVIIILPLMILGVYMYNWSYKNAREDINRQMTAQLSTYLENLHREVEWLEIQQFNFLEDMHLNKLAFTWDFMDPAEKKANTDHVLHQLTTFKNSSPYVKDVYVHIPLINKSFSTVKLVHNFDSHSYRYFITYRKEDVSRLIRKGNTLHLAAVKYGARQGEGPLFIIHTELDSTALRKSLQQFNFQSASGSFIISESTGFMLTSDIDSNIVMSNYVNNDRDDAERNIVTVRDQQYFVNNAYSDQLDMTIATYFPLDDVEKPLRVFHIWAWLLVFVFFLAIIIYSYSTYRFVHKPLLLLIRSFRKMEEGEIDIQIEHETKDEFGFLYSRFNQMIRKLQRLIDQDYKQKMMMQRAELKQLQSQINPHFLYNSFFILSSLAKIGDVDTIEQFTHMLGEYFRYITRNSEDDVNLSEETKHSFMYTEIQKVRFSRRIQVDFAELPQEMAHIRVPKLIIQPIIENAYEHSLENVTGDGLLRVSFEMDDEFARIIVEDNGEHLNDFEIEALKRSLQQATESHEMTGMVNIHRRLLLIYGEGSGLFVSRSELNGLKVIIQIRLQEGVA